MAENSEKINQLLEQIETLLKRQESFVREINGLRGEIIKLKTSEDNQIVSAKQEGDTFKPIVKEVVEEKVTTLVTEDQNQIQKPKWEQPKYTSEETDEDSWIKKDLEKFIGENLINKIGIAVTIIGVAIGTKYSIEHQLISPLTRIILGYLMGLGLLGFGIKLKKNYENYSAVLVSGAMAIMYFITYFAYSFYSLIPQELAFFLMVVFTVITVLAALNYDKQVIAHIGLVGAYTVPFLLSDGSGKVLVLFSYMAIINIGILVIAFRKYWKPLYYSAFVLTWIIYLSWYLSKFQSTEHIGLAFTFIAIFFAIFYSIFLAYKLLKKEEFNATDIILVMSNTFLFYGIGYSILHSYELGKDLLGLYTIGNAVIHTLVAFIILKQKQADRNLYYFIVGLALVFVTIAIPVQLNGNWITLLWSGEAALLFWIGRTKNIKTYEMLSYPLMAIAFFSLIQNWALVYINYNPGQLITRITPIINVHFLTSILFILFFSFIAVLNQNKKYTSPLTDREELLMITSFLIPAILVFALYYSFFLEIANYWKQLYHDSDLIINGELEQRYTNSDLLKFKSIWLINYSLLFFSLLSLVNIRKLKNQLLGFTNLGLNVLVLLVFLFLGLYSLSELRDTYLHQTLSQYYYRGFFNIGIKYVSLSFVAVLLAVTYKYIRQEFMKNDLKVAFDIILHTSIVWIASSELISWMDFADSSQSYKLGLSILWGVYSLILISLGIWKRMKHLRIAAIVLFGATLLKLFLYDISKLDTISKTIVFVILGLLLLIISFLYNKYKNIISEEFDKED